jgi:hypothetical protein
MPLEDQEKKELEEKIRRHRRRIWLGEIADSRHDKEQRIKEKLSQKEDVPVSEPLVTKPSRKKTSKAEKEFWVDQESPRNQWRPNFGLIALVMSGLITSIAVGILIGYLLAVYL